MFLCWFWCVFRPSRLTAPNEFPYAYLFGCCLVHLHDKRMKCLLYNVDTVLNHGYNLIHGLVYYVMYRLYVLVYCSDIDGMYWHRHKLSHRKNMLHVYSYVQGREKCGELNCMDTDIVACWYDNTTCVFISSASWTQLGLEYIDGLYWHWHKGRHIEYISYVCIAC